MFGIPYHFLIVHFPFVLIAGALFSDLGKNHEAGYRFTFWAAVSGALAILTGLFQVGGELSELPVHASAGIGGALMALVLAVLRYSRRARGEDAFLQSWLVLEILAVLGIVVAVVTGHRAVLGL
jgi:uncharacterized membrane protein